MAPVSARSVAAAALRDLNHAFVAHDADDEQLLALADVARAQTAALDDAPNRDRLPLMRAAIGERRFPSDDDRSGFADRAVAGMDNPTSVDIEVVFEPDEVVAGGVLGARFEGPRGARQ